MSSKDTAKFIVSTIRIFVTIVSVSHAWSGDYIGAAYWLAFTWVSGQK